MSMILAALSAVALAAAPIQAQNPSTAILYNASLSSSGSVSVVNFYGGEADLTINIGTVSAGSLAFTVADADPQNPGTAITGGTSVTTPAISSSGTLVLSSVPVHSAALLISWASSSFSGSGIYVTLNQKQPVSSASAADGGSSTVAFLDAGAVQVADCTQINGLGISFCNGASVTENGPDGGLVVGLGFDAGLIIAGNGTVYNDAGGDYSWKDSVPILAIPEGRRICFDENLDAGPCQSWIDLGWDPGGGTSGHGAWDMNVVVPAGSSWEFWPGGVESDFFDGNGNLTVSGNLLYFGLNAGASGPMFNDSSTSLEFQPSYNGAAVPIWMAAPVWFDSTGATNITESSGNLVETYQGSHYLEFYDNSTLVAYFGPSGFLEETYGFTSPQYCLTGAVDCAVPSSTAWTFPQSVVTPLVDAGIVCIAGVCETSWPSSGGLPYWITANTGTTPGTLTTDGGGYFASSLVVGAGSTNYWTIAGSSGNPTLTPSNGDGQFVGLLEVTGDVELDKGAFVQSTYALNLGCTGLSCTSSIADNGSGSLVITETSGQAVYLNGGSAAAQLYSSAGALDLGGNNGVVNLTSATVNVGTGLSEYFTLTAASSGGATLATSGGPLNFYDKTHVFGTGSTDDLSIVAEASGGPVITTNAGPLNLESGATDSEIVLSADQTDNLIVEGSSSVGVLMTTSAGPLLLSPASNITEISAGSSYAFYVAGESTYGPELYTNAGALLLGSHTDHLGVALQGTSPTCSGLAGCWGSGATCTVTTGSTDSAGSVVISTAVSTSSCAAGGTVLMSIVPHTNFGSAPAAFLNVGGNTDGGGTPVWPSLEASSLSTGLNVYGVSAFTPNTLSKYTIDYWAIGISPGGA